MKMVVAVAALCAAIGGCSEGDKPIENESGKITATILANSPDCKDPEYPVALIVGNTNEKRLLSHTVVVDMKRKGHSTVLLSQQYPDDMILAQGMQTIRCIPRKLGVTTGIYPNEVAEGFNPNREEIKSLPPEELEYETSIFSWNFEEPKASS